LNNNYDGRLVLGAGILPNENEQDMGTYTISNGALHARGLNIGNFGRGVFTQSGGTVIADVGAIVGFGSDDFNRQSQGTVNLNGGVFQTAAITGGGGAAPGVSAVNFNGGTLRALANQPNFIATLTTANVQAGGLVVDSNGFDVGSNQAFSGSGGLTKQGAGVLTLSGSNAYSGTTAVQAGSLLVTGSHTGGGAYNVASQATLGGTGTISAGVTVNGSLAPGTSIGPLTVNGNVDFGSSGIFDVEINAATHTADLLVVNGNLNLSGLSDMLKLTLIGGVLPEAGPLTIATYTGTLTGTFNLDNADLTIDYGDGSNGAITISNITSIGGQLGDYNNDGKVNAADYTVYRNRKVGIGGTTLPNDATPASVDFEDYTYWKNHFGEPGAGLGNNLVPEPATLWPLVCGLLIAECAGRVFAGRRRRPAQRTGFGA
jgi:fibronectin-binding autotransporter adhesin